MSYSATKLNSRAAANGASQDSGTRTYKTARGIELTIHPVPQTIIQAVVPKRPKPELPLVDMKLPKGDVQKRPAKESDVVWPKYQEELNEWLRERKDLQEAITFCMALKTYPFPDTFSLSPDVQALVDAGYLTIPDDPYLRKFAWIRENLLGQHDEYQVTMILNELAGVPEDIVKAMKDSFRDFLLGKAPDTVGAGDEDGSTNSQDNQADGEV